MAARKPGKKSPTTKASASEGRPSSRRNATPERLPLNSADPNEADIVLDFFAGIAPTVSDVDALARQLRLCAGHVKPDRGDDDLLYEILLKAGLPLTEPGTVKKASGARVHWFEVTVPVICLERSLKRTDLRMIVELAPRRVSCLNQAFGGTMTSRPTRC